MNSVYNIIIDATNHSSDGNLEMIEFRVSEVDLIYSKVRWAISQGFDACVRHELINKINLAIP